MTIENFNYHEVVRDTNSTEKIDGGYGVEIVRGPKNTDVVENLQELESSLVHDKPITSDQVLRVDQALDLMKITVGGEEMTVEEMRKIPDLEVNVEIWKEIESGDLSHHWKLTHITPHVAELLSGQDIYLTLNNLASISDVVAEVLSKHRYELDLRSLVSISDTTAEQLSKHQGDLYLNRLINISEVAAEHLSKHQGKLDFHGFVSISDAVAEHLSKHKGILDLSGLTSISDIAASHLAQHEGKVFTLRNIEQKIALLRKRKFRLFRKPEYGS